MLKESDFIIMSDQFGWKLVNNHKFHELSRDVDKSDPLVAKSIWKQSHTHLKSHRMCFIMRDNIIKNRMPKTKNERLLRSHMRIAEDQEYINLVHERIINIKKFGRQYYLDDRRENNDNCWR